MSKLFDWFRTGDDDDTHPLSEHAMLKYFMGMLDVKIKFITPMIAADADKMKHVKEVEAGIDGFDKKFQVERPGLLDEAWCEAYRLERILGLAQPRDLLVGELRNRIAEAIDEKVAAAPRLSLALDAALPLAVDSSKLPPAVKTEGESLLRQLLLETLEQTHWTLQRKFYARPLQRSATYRIVNIGLLAFLLFLLPYVAINAEFMGTAPKDLDRWSWLPLYVTLTTGLLGALFSRVLYLQANWNLLSLGSIQDARDINSILLRGSVGMIGAVLIYFFMQSGVVSSDMIPHFDKIAFNQIKFAPEPREAKMIPFSLIYPDRDMALLVVWSFIAGFSERLVPSILQSTETAVNRTGKT